MKKIHFIYKGKLAKQIVYRIIYENFCQKNNSKLNKLTKLLPEK